jgi:hypothetical protein
MVSSSALCYIRYIFAFKHIPEKGKGKPQNVGLRGKSRAKM